MIITIDGAAGTGKSTVAKKLASRLGFVFFETGAMYRAVTYKLLKERIAISEQEKIRLLLEHFHFKIDSSSKERRYFIGAEDVTDEIRSAHVTQHVSEVSALSAVRAAMVGMQRRFAEGIDAVFEGRDMGTVVFPEAEIKVFLTAEAEIRAERRFREFVLKHPSEAENLTKQQVLEDLLRRDAHDSTRELSPLKPAEDAKMIDTSYLTSDEVVDCIESYLK